MNRFEIFTKEEQESIIAAFERDEDSLSHAVIEEVEKEYFQRKLDVLTSLMKEVNQEYYFKKK